MDIKWNRFIEKVFDFGIRYRELFGGIVSFVAGACFYSKLAVGYYYTVERVLVYTIVIVLFWSIAVWLVLSHLLRKKYAGWSTDETSVYQAWIREIAQYRKKLYFRGGILVVVTMYLDYELIPVRVCTWVIALLELFLAQAVLQRFSEKKTKEIMAQLDELNKQQIDKALELERKSLAEISRSDKLRVELITNVSHDLKTPVTSMVGYLELMKKEELSDTMRDYVDVLCKKTDKLSEMINSLFSLSQASSGNVELHMENFELNRLLEQILADLKDKIDASELQFVSQFTKENTALVSDNMYFYRICQNLLENTLKYSMKGTRVFVKTFAKENGNLGLEITNTSAYLIDFEKEDIMERFSRGDKARTTDGNGLGLAIVSTYTKALGGEFDIKLDCDQFKAYLEFPRNKN